MTDQMATLQALGGIAFWLLIITIGVRRWNAASRHAGEALRTQSERDERDGTAATARPVGIFATLAPYAMMISLSVLAMFTTLYGFVRFIKWAWTD